VVLGVHDSSLGKLILILVNIEGDKVGVGSKSIIVDDEFDLGSLISESSSNGCGGGGKGGLLGGEGTCCGAESGLGGGDSGISALIFSSSSSEYGGWDGAVLGHVWSLRGGASD
jgi:hypothetical protein